MLTYGRVRRPGFAVDQPCDLEQVKSIPSGVKGGFGQALTFQLLFFNDSLRPTVKSYQEPWKNHRWLIVQTPRKVYKGGSKKQSPVGRTHAMFAGRGRGEKVVSCTSSRGWSNLKMAWSLTPVCHQVPLQRVSVAQSCPTLRPRGLQPSSSLCPWDFPGKETGVGCIPFSRGSSQPKDQTCAFCTAPRFFTDWATRALLNVFICKARHLG